MSLNNIMARLSQKQAQKSQAMPKPSNRYVISEREFALLMGALRCSYNRTLHDKKLPRQSRNYYLTSTQELIYNLRQQRLNNQQQ